VTLVVEDGTGLANAESYASVITLRAYLTDRGNTAADGKTDAVVEAGLRRATRYVDGRYGQRWAGYRVRGREQALDWPRTSVVDSRGDDVADDQVPNEVFEATCEAAAREIVAPGSLTPDASAKRIITATVGPVSTTWADDGAGSSVRPTSTIIDELLWPLLLTGSSSVLALMRA
jgi:hypothetical protein